MLNPFGENICNRRHYKVLVVSNKKDMLSQGNRAMPL